MCLKNKCFQEESQLPPSEFELPKKGSSLTSLHWPKPRPGDNIGSVSGMPDFEICIIN